MDEIMECDAVRDPKQPHMSAAIARGVPGRSGTGEAAFVLHGMLAGEPAEETGADGIKLPAAKGGQTVRVEVAADRADRTEVVAVRADGDAGTAPDLDALAAQPADGAANVPDPVEISEDDADLVGDERFADGLAEPPHHPLSRDRSVTVDSVIEGESAEQPAELGILEHDPNAESGADWPVGPSHRVGPDNDDPLASAPPAGQIAAVEPGKSAVIGPVLPGAARGNDRATAGEAASALAMSLPRHLLLRPLDFSSTAQDIGSGRNSPTLAAEPGPLVSARSMRVAALGTAVDLEAMPPFNWRDTYTEIAPRDVRSPDASGSPGVSVRSGGAMAMPWMVPQAGTSAGALSNGPNPGDLMLMAQEDVAAGSPPGLAPGWHSAPFAAVHMAGVSPSHALPVPPGVIIRQLAEAVVHMRDDRIEIALSPEELGNVRMTLTRNEAGGALTLWVERPELLDALRRNVELIQADLNETGLGGLQLEFRDGSDRDPEGQGRGDADDDAGGALAVAGRHPIRANDAEGAAGLAVRSMAPDGWRLDIRV